jgi:hypothetical protein
MKPQLLLSFLLLSVAGFAQQAPSPTAKPPIVLPPKKANTAIIQRRDSGLVALTAMMQGLITRGYTIKEVNREALTVRTEPRAVSEVGAVVIEGAVRGHQLVLTGAFAPELNSRRSTPIEYLGEGRTGRAAVAWEELVKTAGVIGRNVSFSAQ